MNNLLKKFAIVILSIVIFGGSYFYLKFQESDYNALINQAYKKKEDFSSFIVIDGAFEPAVPDKKTNLKDHSGIDSDNNGIRDDIDIWINRMGQSFNERMAMRQYSKVLQAFQKNCQENNFSSSASDIEKIDESFLCLSMMSEFQREGKRSYDTDMLNILIFNTDLRKACYKMEKKSEITKQVSIDLLKANCHFEVENPSIIIEVNEALRATH